MGSRDGSRQHLRGTALAEPEPEVCEAKYECVYLHAWGTGSEVRAGAGKWIDPYNHKHAYPASGGKPQPWFIGREKKKPDPIGGDEE